MAIAPVLFMFCVIATAFAAPGPHRTGSLGTGGWGAAALLTIGPVVVGWPIAGCCARPPAARFLPGSGPQPT